MAHLRYKYLDKLDVEPHPALSATHRTTPNEYYTSQRHDLLLHIPQELLCSHWHHELAQ